MEQRGKSQFFGRAAAALLLAGLALSGCADGNGGGTTNNNTTTTNNYTTVPTDPCPTCPVFFNGQNAVSVIGQADFISGNANRGLAAPTSATLSGPNGVHVLSSGLFISDTNNNRILRYETIPLANNASAVGVMGQANLTTGTLAAVSLGGVSSPNRPGADTSVAGNNNLYAPDIGYRRVAIYSGAATGGGATATGATVTGALGVNSTTGIGGAQCIQSELVMPGGVSAAGGKLAVVDTGGSRVLLWSTAPASNATNTTLPDVVLGQPNFTTCAVGVTASNMQDPGGVWTDGTRLLVADTNNHRILVWNSWPTTPGQAADLVLGQSSLTAKAIATTQSGLNSPLAVKSNGTQIFVADSLNRRVMIWNSWPTVNGQPADAVLGQPDFTSSRSATTWSGMANPTDVAHWGKYLVVTDSSANRALVFEGQ